MIYEYRVYDYASPAHLTTLLEVMEAAFSLFKKHGMTIIGCWTTHTTISEKSNRLTYMLAFDNLDHLEKSWELFRADPEWPEIVSSITNDGGKPFISGGGNHLMRPTEFSPLQ